MKKIVEMVSFDFPTNCIIPINVNDDDEHKKHIMIDVPLCSKESHNIV